MTDKKTEISPSKQREIIENSQNQNVSYSKSFNNITTNSFLIEGASLPNISIKTLYGSSSIHKYKTHNLLIFFTLKTILQDVQLNPKILVIYTPNFSH